MAMSNQPSFDAPIPGQSLTMELGSRPWQNPSRFTNVDDTIDYYMERMSSEEFMVQLDVEGLYGIKCKPHYQMGMIALIQVGEVSADDIEKSSKVKQRGKAKDRFKLLFAGL